MEHMIYTKSRGSSMQSFTQLSKFSLYFNIDYEELPLQLQMEFMDLQCSEDLKSKFHCLSLP